MRSRFLLTLACAAAVFTAARAHAFEQRDVKVFCSNPELMKPPAPGMDFRNKPADEKIMNLAGGEYKLTEGGTLHLNEDGTYLVDFGTKPMSLRGTQGDDMLRGKKAIGCFREQLSELFDRNGGEFAPASRPTSR